MPVFWKFPGFQKLETYCHKAIWNCQTNHKIPEWQDLDHGVLKCMLHQCMLLLQLPCHGQPYFIIWPTTENWQLELRERPFHYWGGWKIFFQQIICSVDVEARFFFTLHLKSDFFFTKNWRSDCFNSFLFFRVEMFFLGGAFRLEARFFFATYQSKNIFVKVEAGPNYFFPAKSSARLFFQKVFQPPPPIMEWLLPYKPKEETVVHRSHYYWK